MILGYSDAGNFDPQNIPVNMYEWLQGYEDEIQFGIENGISASAEIAADWEKLSSGQGLSPKRSRSVNALVQTRWNQGSPYNNLCPYDSGEGERTVTGCVATAMAQIMKYWNYPTQGNGSVTYNATGYGNQTANFGNTTYDWNNMLNTYSNSATSAQKNAVATLMYHCGVAVHMSYGVSSTGGSGAVTVGSSNGTAEYAMKNYFLYKNTLAGRYRSSYSDTNWKNMMYTDLDAGRPIIYTGRGDGGGHCFICDGYNNSNQFHFNWGWGGYCDGFYAINSLKPGTGGIGSGNGTYNESQSAIFGIEPNVGLFAIPNALTFSGLGESKTFMVRASTSSNQSWTATSSQTWLELSPSTGAGNGANTTVTAHASRNNTASERTATVTITQGSATTTVTVVQPSGIANDPGCFGTDGYDYIYPIESSHMVIICGEGFGYFTTGHKITKVKFTTVDGATTSSYTNYTNNSFTIKIYENGNTESLSSGYTSNIAGAMGTQVYSQNYTQTSFGAQEVVLNTPYTIDETKNFWIAVVANGNTLFLCNDVEVGEPIEVSSYVSSMAIAAASGNYLYTESYSSTDRLYLNYAAYYTDNSRTTVQTYSVEYALSYYISDGDSPYMLTSDIGAIFLVSNADLHYAAETMSLGATDNLVVYPGVQNNGPDNATQPVSVSLKLGSEVLDEGTINFSETNALEPPLFTWIYGSPYSYTVTADQLNQMLVTGTFDVCFNADYSGHDNNESNNTTCITVTRATPSFTISASASPAAVGTITGTGTYELGEGVNLVATPNTGYNFTNWTENGTVVSTNATYTFTATANRTLVANFTQRTYNVTATVDPANSGTISGNNSPYTYGTNVSLTANANAGYAFVNWTDEDANVVSTNANYQFTIDGNRTFVAHFEIEEYEITATANPTAGGSVTGAGTFQYGQNVTLNATANTGYTFTNWTENGSVVSSNAEYSFTATASRTLVANFQINTYNISATANPTAGGTISGAGEYTHGENVTLTATANTGYDFVNWTENGAAVSTETSISFTATADRNLVANFSIESYTISATASPSNGGTVSGTGEYDYGQTVTLSATPSTGYHFVNWTDNGVEVSTSAEYSFTATADRTLVANFSINRYHVTATVNDPTKGNVTIEGETTDGMYDYGTVLVMTAAATEGNHFVAWNDGVTDAQREYTVVADVDFVANFAQDGVVSYIITATANPTDGGTITGVGPYEENTTVTLNAIASEGYTFANWTENDVVVSTDAEYSFTATADRALVANFTINTYIISATAYPTDGGTIEGAGEYTHGETVTLRATANTGYTFANWTEDGVEVSADAEYSFTATESRTLVANFDIPILPNIIITATANPTDGGTIEGAGEYTQGETATLRATANTGYTFTNWTEDGEVVSTDAQYSFTATADRSLVANFAINTYTITVEAGEGGDVFYNGELATTVTVEEGAIPSFEINCYLTPEGFGYIIGTITVDGEEVELPSEDLTNYIYTFEPVMANHTLAVTFVFVSSADMIETGAIAVYPNPNNGMFTLSMESIEGDVTCQIVNANGSVIETREMSATDGSEFVFDCNVAPGAYFVRVISGDRVWTKSVVIDR